MTRDAGQELEQEAHEELEAAYREGQGKERVPERVPGVPVGLQEEARAELERAHREEQGGAGYRTGPTSGAWRAMEEVSADFAVPEQGWQCPSCGMTFEQEGVCPVDATPLQSIDKWESTLPETDSAEEAMGQGDDFYPEPNPSDWPLTAGRTP